MTRTCSHHDALTVLESYGDSSSAFLALNAGNEFFTTPECSGMIAYKPQGRRYWIQFTGACAQTASARATLDEAFSAAAAREGKRVFAVQLGRSDAERAARSGWTVNQLGSSYSIDLSAFTLHGQKFVKTRNMISRSKREGVVVSEVTPERLQDPLLMQRLDDIDAEWLRSKGRHTKELRLMIGERGGPLQHRRRVFVAEVSGVPVAYVSYAPVFGSQAGWLYDLTRRRPDAPPGVVEHIFAYAADLLRDEGHGWVHLGFTPFVDIHPDHEIAGASSSTLTKVAELVRKHGSSLYPAESQLAFKSKWRPHQITPEYIAFPRRIRLQDVWQLAQATNSL